MDCMRNMRGKITVACACACVIFTHPAQAVPSTRPGWGATPYGAGGTGVTFRVWAPNAGSVTVKGSFNGFNNVSTPLFSEGTNGIWSVDVSNAVVGQQYKYRINASIDKQDPRARNQLSSVGNCIIYNTTNFSWAGDTFVSTNIPLSDAVVYELNIASFNNPSPSGGCGGNPGTFLTATN